MTDDELEAHIQSYDVEMAALAPLGYGRFAVDHSALASSSQEIERCALSTYLFRLPKEWSKTRVRESKLHC